MTIGLNNEDRELRDSVRGWAARHATPTVLREAVEAKVEMRPTYWGALAELGMRRAVAVDPQPARLQRDGAEDGSVGQ
ncbi:hypothetical protein [Prescottella equi]|uniref:hypothetical protein n=1 Tax=Rhodococcus hoagii TaxID=43767 RepID=UPI003B7DC3CB